jgi:hypothetical protein
MKRRIDVNSNETPANITRLLNELEADASDTWDHAALVLAGAVGEPGLRSKLLDRLSDQEQRARRVVVAALAGAASEREVRDALLSVIQDDADGGVRAEAITALGPTAADDPAVLDKVLAALDDEEPEVRDAARSALRASLVAVEAEMAELEGLDADDDPQALDLLAGLTDPDSQPVPMGAPETTRRIVRQASELARPAWDARVGAVWQGSDVTVVIEPMRGIGDRVDVLMGVFPRHAPFSLLEGQKVTLGDVDGRQSERTAHLDRHGQTLFRGLARAHYQVRLRGWQPQLQVQRAAGTTSYAARRLGTISDATGDLTVSVDRSPSGEAIWLECEVTGAATDRLAVLEMVVTRSSEDRGGAHEEPISLLVPFPRRQQRAAVTVGRADVVGDVAVSLLDIAYLSSVDAEVLRSSIGAALPEALEGWRDLMGDSKLEGELREKVAGMLPEPPAEPSGRRAVDDVPVAVAASGASLGARVARVIRWSIPIDAINNRVSRLSEMSRPFAHAAGPSGTRNELPLSFDVGREIVKSAVVRRSVGGENTLVMELKSEAEATWVLRDRQGHEGAPTTIGSAMTIEIPLDALPLDQNRGGDIEIVFASS